jgi:hypothetical protein
MLQDPAEWHQTVDSPDVLVSPASHTTYAITVSDNERATARD